MAIRIDIEGAQIKIMRPHARNKEWNVHQEYPVSQMEMVMIMIRYWISVDVEIDNKERFVSQAKRDARKAFKQLQERSPYRGKR